jgi:hypothetical protein
VKVPGAASAIVAEDKVRNYLLSGSHFLGRGKARFFGSHGYQAENWKDFGAALRQHILTQPARLSKENIYGSFYEVDGPLNSPTGTNPMIRSVWIIERNSSIPKLITAHPLT